MFDIDKINKLPPEQQKELLDLLSQYESAKKQEDCSDNFLSFVKEITPPVALLLVLNILNCGLAEVLLEKTVLSAKNDFVPVKLCVPDK